MRDKMKHPSKLLLAVCIAIGAAVGAMSAYFIGEKTWLIARIYVYVGGAAGGILGWVFSSMRK